MRDPRRAPRERVVGTAAEKARTCSTSTSPSSPAEKPADEVELQALREFIQESKTTVVNLVERVDSVHSKELTFEIIVLLNSSRRR
ncbi:hypothetical protein TrLO_g10767 [Triparma laevis f. longispina]|uniref:Uncharacterized protein n=1 Tax=Triparma laevis f. longispina TaxID=1714387 RepID=A0A9W7KZK2_9STRA|nr:hypothetical protein TrLO_g10767 [Triparma laevis f. longispina]